MGIVVFNAKYVFPAIVAILKIISKKGNVTISLKSNHRGKMQLIIEKHNCRKITDRYNKNIGQTRYSTYLYFSINLFFTHVFPGRYFWF